MTKDVLVSAELAKEKLIKVLEELRPRPIVLMGKTEAYANGIRESIKAIRNTDLTDCQQSSGLIAPAPDLGNNPSATPSGTHSAEPWEQTDRALGGGTLEGGAIITRSFPGNVIPDNTDMSKFCIAENVKPDNASRIVACVNACKGIPTEDLERWGISLIDKIREDEGALRFTPAEIQPGNDLTNAQRIMIELADLFATVEMLVDDGVLVPLPDDTRIETKKAKILKFMDYSRELGILEPQP